MRNSLTHTHTHTHLYTDSFVSSSECVCSREEVLSIQEVARSKGLEVIPLVQTFGHMEVGQDCSSRESTPLPLVSDGGRVFCKGIT